MLAGVSAHATIELFNSGSSVGAIPDGDLAGATFAGTVSDFSAGATVDGSQLTVSLNFSGGYDGNLYSYLVAPNGTTVVLLNTSANSGSGMNITLADGGPAITASSGLSSGTYAAAGTLANFNGVVADGTWDLFVADEVTGGGTSTLNSWSMNVSAVPEPSTWGVISALGLLGICGLREWRQRKRVKGA